MAANASGSVVVTGASTGIGRATALRLDADGYWVFAGVRKDADGQALAQAASDRLTPVTLDVTDVDQIESAREQVAEAVAAQGLVGLVNNAGVGGGGPIEFMPLDELRRTLEVNLIGQVAVTQAFIPLIRKGKGTIVFIASIGGRVASPFMSPYNTSKFAIEALGESLRHELHPWGIDVAVVEPGSIDTQIWSKGNDQLREQVDAMPEDAQRLYGKQITRFGEVINETASRGIPPEKVAEVVHKAIASEKPRHRYLVGTDAKIGARLKGTLPDRVFHRLAGRQMKMPTDVPPS
ncbi:MAG TPA: SDR family oxidoreductase [Solirubrobacterales bacterium]|jgi:NAD(P)-dependent dehydrogenase (short-subunit alcohol dehydrogenase family)|nr:SDR family oxidoreductase [Solirubrobacterales bacterium]